MYAIFQTVISRAYTAEDISDADITSYSEQLEQSARICIFNNSCGMKFRVVKELKQHLAKHLNYSLIDGMIHSNYIGGAHHTCLRCQYSAHNKQHVRDHVMLHLNIKPHACPHCHYKSNQKSHLSSHIRRLHRPT